MTNLLIGTSGWNYVHWKKIFYPTGLEQKEWLQHYARFFNCVELNVTFYRLLEKRVFEHWYRQTPNSFRFVAKGSRYITHIKKLSDDKKSLQKFFTSVAGLKEKLAAVLWQLPPNFKKNHEKLEAFLNAVQGSAVSNVFEFRHESWFDKDIYELLRRYKACLCLAHSDRFPYVEEVTSNFLYFRFHGTALYRSNYPDEELKRWAQRIQKLMKTLKNGEDSYAFFNNDVAGYAVENALILKELLVKKL